MKPISKENILYFAGVILIFLSFVNIFIVSGRQYSLKDGTLEKNTDCFSKGYQCVKRFNNFHIKSSIKLSMEFLINNQGADGSFQTDYNDNVNKFPKNTGQETGSMALWNLSRSYKLYTDSGIKSLIKKSYNYFSSHSGSSADGRKWIIYPSEKTGRTETTAYFLLTLIELLDPVFEIPSEDVKLKIKAYGDFLISLHIKKGRFNSYYRPAGGTGYGRSLLNVDGLVLLALFRAEKYLQKKGLASLIKDAAKSLLNTTYDFFYDKQMDARRTAVQKMVFPTFVIITAFEIAKSGWEDADEFAELGVKLADIAIDHHCGLLRNGKIPEAYAGVIYAYRFLELKDNNEKKQNYYCLIDTGLFRMSSSQLGNPLQNREFQDSKVPDKYFKGNILRNKSDHTINMDLVVKYLFSMLTAEKYLVMN